MIVICRNCGEINQIKKVKSLSPVIDIVCKQCGVRNRLEYGMTSQSASVVKCLNCGYAQPQTDKCVKCGASMIILPPESPVLDESDEGKRGLLQKRYKILTIVAVFLILLIFIGSLTGVFLMMRSSDAYKLSESYIRNNKEIRETVGDDITFGFIPLGSVKVSGRVGVADFKIHVKGSKGSTDVQVFLKKTSGQWRIVSAVYTDRYGVKKRITPADKSGTKNK